jgi:hypothetical protein
MNRDPNVQSAFVGSTVISTRRDSAIEGCILRRRQLADGSRVTTGEVSEGMIELLLKTPGGLIRRNTAVNPDAVARAVELFNSGKPRKECEKEMGVGAGTFRRLLAEGGVTSRKYTAVLTDENVVKAVRVAAHYDLTKRGDVIKASKEMGVNSRTLRRLLQKALVTMTLEQIAALRADEKAKAEAAAGQLSMEVTNAAAEPEAPAETAPAQEAVLVAVAGDQVVAETVTPETVASAMVASAAALPDLKPGDPGFVDRRRSGDSSRADVDVSAVAAIATQAAVAAVAAAIPAAVEAVVHPAA